MYAKVEPEWCEGNGMENKMSDIFENLYFVDEYLGHYMWFGGEMICMITFFWGCFVPIGRGDDSTLLEAFKRNGKPLWSQKLRFAFLTILPAYYFPCKSLNP